MSAEVIQFRDFQNPKDLARMYSEHNLEQQAISIMNVALIEDTAPSEYCAPTDDSA